MRHPRLFLFAIILHGVPASAQQEIQPVEVSPAISAALERTDVALDAVMAWPVDWTPHDDLLVQAVYSFIGGNGVAEINWRIVSLTADGPVFGAEFDLPGAGIESVAPHPQGAFLVVHEYLPGDARCCPSGRKPVILARPAP